MYSPDMQTLEYIQQILTDLKEGDSTIMVVASLPHYQQQMNHPDRKSAKQCCNQTQLWNKWTLNRHCRTFHLPEAKYTRFISTHRTFPRTDPMIGHKTNIRKFKKKLYYLFWPGWYEIRNQEESEKIYKYVEIK